jgi:hypothetical protein
MAGIICVIIAWLFTIVAIVLRLMARPPRLFHWSVFALLSLFLIEVALLWGNISVIYSHAGLTG